MTGRAIWLAAAFLVSWLVGTAAAQPTHEIPGTQRPTTAAPGAVYPAGCTQRWIEDADFVYGPRLLDFDVSAYIQTTAPHLSPYAASIQHWCGFYSISPKVLLAVMEVQSGAVTDAAAATNPFAGLAQGADVEAQVRWTLAALFEDYYAYRAAAGKPGGDALNAGTYALLNLFRGAAPVAAFADAANATGGRFAATLGRLFGDKVVENDDITAAIVPAANLMQLPFKNGVSWWFGGVHTTTGGNVGAMSSLDFYRGGAWGTDTSGDFVVAAHSGTVTVHSTCNVTVTSPSGWTTNYYHLSTLQVSNGQQVAANQTIGVYANNFAQATCQGGSSSGPHVHFSLLFNGEYMALHGAALSGYVVNSGRFSYDTDPAFMWVEKNGTRYYANVGTGQPPITSTATIVPNLTINDVSVSEGNTGTKNATFTISLSQPAVTTTTVNYATEDGTATSGLVRSNATAVTLPSMGAGTPYPSNIDMGSGSGPVITKVVAVLRNYSHVYPGDVGALLVAPTGHRVWLMSGIGGGNDANNATLTFDDDGVSMPLASQPVTGTYKPTVNPGASQLPPAPAPAGPYSSTMSAFNGLSPYGVWKLYAYDGAAGDAGVLAGGWTLNITTTEGSLDYVSAAGTVTIATGASSQTFSVVVNGDTAIEPDETFRVNLSTPSGANIVDGQGVATIVGDDALTLTINDVSLTEGHSSSKTATFTVSLSQPSANHVSFQFATANVTAVAGTDYVATSGGITMAIGATSVDLSVTVNGDTAVEPAETFVVNLSSPGNAVIADGQGAGTILNDDYLPFTDPTLTSQATAMRLIHITELRTRVNAARTARGLTAFAFTDNVLTAGTMIKAVHILELRTALAQAYAAASLAAPAFTDSSLSGVLIKTVHIMELRSAVMVLE